MNGVIFYAEEGEAVVDLDEDKGEVYGYCKFYG